MSGQANAATVDATSPARPDEPSSSTDRASSGETEIEPEAILSPGERAGDFVIEGILGRGSFGTVYRASHHVIGRRAAVKVLRDRAAGAARVQAFIEEARLVSRLRHPHIVDVLTFGRLADGRHFQVMDLIDGPTLDELLRERGRLPLVEALPILRGIASALDAVHRSGVTHRDLKPANVVLERRGEGFVPKLIDFGVAELRGSDEAGERAERSGVVGTPRYMAPEQCRGQIVDARADAYAFGLLAHEVLTGEPPFSGADALDLMLKHTEEAPPVPSTRCRDLPSALDPILLALLDKNPERRPTGLEGVVDRMAATLRSDAASTALPRKPRRGLVVVAMLGAVVATVAWVRLDRDPATGAASGLGPAPASPEPPRAAGPTAGSPEAEAESLPIADPAPSMEATPSAEVSRARAAPAPPAVTVPSPSGPAPRPPRATGVSGPAEPGLEDTDNPFRR